MGHSKTDTARDQDARTSAKLCRSTGHHRRRSGCSALYSPTTRGITRRSAYGPKCRYRHFGPAFIKVCAYFPYPAKIWVNGHERARRQARKAGIGFTALSNGFAACDDPAGLQAICDRLQPGTIEVSAQRWLARLPMPSGRKDQLAGYWRETSMRQVEVSRTIVFDAPRRARGFFGP